MPPASIGRAPPARRRPSRRRAGEGPSVRSMHAAVYDHTGGPEVLRYAEVPDPELRPGGVLVDVGAVSIQGGDLLHRAGRRSAVRAAHRRLPGRRARACGRRRRHRLRASASRWWPRWAPAATPSSSACRPGRRTRSPTGCRSTRPPACRSSSAPPTTACSSSATCSRARRCCAGRRRRRRAGRHPAGQGGRRATVIATASSDDRSIGCTSTAWTTASTTRARTSAEGARLTDGRGVDLVVDPVGGRTLEGSIAAPRLPRPDQLGRPRRPRGPPPRRCGRSCRRTPRSPACSSAPRWASTRHACTGR